LGLEQLVTVMNDTDTSIRDSKIAFLRSSDEANKWIFERITGAIININRQFWNFELSRIETLQYSEYGVGQFYKPHIDMMYPSPSRAIRKLSFTVQLTDPSEYEGGDVVIKSGTMRLYIKIKELLIFSHRIFCMKWNQLLKVLDMH
jgi:predicted 2-oxoglutarate/Fe(II)-dependent dioxygenase YbiX